jgi:glycosyltransferase involved in cell wall biosynthesis
LRIVLIDPSLYTPPYDGALARALSGMGHAVTLIGRPPRSTDPDPLSDIDLRQVFYRRSERLRATSGAGPLMLAYKCFEHVLDLPRVRALLRGLDPDVVHWQWPSLPVVDALLLGSLSRQCPQVVTVHDSNLFHHRSIGRLRAVGWRDFLSRASRLIAHVGSTRDALLRIGMDPQRIDIVPHGIFPARYASNAAPRDSQAVRVLFFGRVSRDKGVDILLEAIEAFPDELRGRVIFEIAGPPAADARTLSRARALAAKGHLRLQLERIPEERLDAALSASHVVVLPHRDVDASGVLMKAMACDICFVASDIPSFREVLSPGAAAFFKAGDAMDLRDKLVHAVCDDHLRASVVAAVSRLRTPAYSWPEVARQTIEVYRRALSGASMPSS